MLCAQNMLGLARFGFLTCPIIFALMEFEVEIMVVNVNGLAWSVSRRLTN